jgi:hypothetical protein
MKKICIIITSLLIIFMVGCNIKDASGNEARIEVTHLNLGERLIQSEQDYLKSNSDEDLKRLCWALDMQLGCDNKVPQMVLEYYPELFSRVTSDQMSGFSYHGLDDSYSTYVISYLAEDMGELIPIYQEYKEKAEDKYFYAVCFYGDLSLINNLSTSDQEFLYNEAISLYEEAKQENYDFHIRLYAFGCVARICELTDKSIDPGMLEEMRELADDYKESIN